MHFSKLFWEELEDAFNTSMGDNFMAKSRRDNASSHQYSITLDDDKVRFNYGAKRNVRFGDSKSRLKRAQHIRDNRRGINNHVLAYTATDIPLVSEFKHEDHLLFDCFIDIMKSMFHFKGDTKPNLSGRAMLAIDHGYMRVAILA